MSIFYIIPIGPRNDRTAILLSFNCLPLDILGNGRVCQEINKFGNWDISNICTLAIQIADNVWIHKKVLNYDHALWSKSNNPGVSK